MISLTFIILISFSILFFCPSPAWLPFIINESLVPITTNYIIFWGNGWQWFRILKLKSTIYLYSFHFFFFILLPFSISTERWTLNRWKGINLHLCDLERSRTFSSVGRHDSWREFILNFTIRFGLFFFHFFFALLCFLDHSDVLHLLR